MKKDSNLIDAAELAQRLSIRVSTIRAWTRLTNMPRIKCGRLVRYRYEDVIRWFERRTKHGGGVR